MRSSFTPNQRRGCTNTWSRWPNRTHIVCTSSFKSWSQFNGMSISWTSLKLSDYLLYSPPWERGFREPLSQFLLIQLPQLGSRWDLHMIACSLAWYRLCSWVDGCNVAMPLRIYTQEAGARRHVYLTARILIYPLKYIPTSSLSKTWRGRRAE